MRGKAIDTVNYKMVKGRVCVCVCTIITIFISECNVSVMIYSMQVQNTTIHRGSGIYGYWRSACARVPNACGVCVCVRRMCTKPLMANFPYELVDCAAIVVIVVIVNVVATGTDFFPIPNIDYSLGAHTQRIFILSSFSIVVIIRTSRLHYSSSSFFFY